MSESGDKAVYQKRGLNPYRHQAILKYAGESILDVCCGSGAYVLKLANKYNIKGVDIQKFDSWSERPELFEIAEPELYKYPEKSVDTILSFETLEHLSDPFAALKEYHRICRKNVILTVPNCDITEGMQKSNMLYSHWSDRTHKQFFNMQSITNLVREAGFNILQSNYINKINIAPLVFELFGLKILKGRIFRKMIQPFTRQEYFITCMVVGTK